MEGDIAGKNGCLVGENTNKGHQKKMVVLLVKTPTRAGGKIYGKRHWEEKKIIVCNETPREGLRRQLSDFGGDYSRKPDPRENRMQ